MITTRIKIMVITCILLSLFLGIWVGIDIKIKPNQNNVDSQPSPPVRSVRITIDPNQQELLFTQLHVFADKWRYAIRIAPLDPNNESYYIEMWRSDMNLSGLYPNNPGILDFGFFNTDDAAPVPESYFDEEITDLKNIIGEIPGATLSVEQ